MSADLGKDVYTVQMLQRKHEGYENELVALEAQLQIVVDDAENLKANYPGDNAHQIGEQQVREIVRVVVVTAGEFLIAQCPFPTVLSMWPMLNDPFLTAHSFPDPFLTAYSFHRRTSCLDGKFFKTKSRRTSVKRITSER